MNIRFKLNTKGAFLIAATLIICYIFYMTESIGVVLQQVLTVPDCPECAAENSFMKIPLVAETIIAVFLLAFVVILVLSTKINVLLIIFSAFTVLFQTANLLINFFVLIDDPFSAFQTARTGLASVALIASVFMLIFVIIGFAAKHRQVGFLKLWFIPLCLYAVGLLCATVLFFLALRDMSFIYIIAEAMTRAPTIARLIILPLAYTMVCLGIYLHNRTLCLEDEAKTQILL